MECAVGRRREGEDAAAGDVVVDDFADDLSDAICDGEDGPAAQGDDGGVDTRRIDGEADGCVGRGEERGQVDAGPGEGRGEGGEGRCVEG